MAMIIWKRYKLKLKIPDPTKHPSTPSCISREQSAGVAKPQAAKFTTGSWPKSAVSFKRSRCAWNLTTCFLDFQHEQTCKRPDAFERRKGVGYSHHNWMMAMQCIYQGI